MKNTIVLLGSLMALACSRGPQLQPNKNRLTPFTVTVVKREPTTAIIQWDSVVNPHTGDTVYYKVMLNGRTVDSDLVLPADILYDLRGDTAYNGVVYAYTRSGDTSSAPFYLNKIKGFVFFGACTDNSVYCYDLYSDTLVWQSPIYYLGSFQGLPTIVNNVLYINNTEIGTYAFNAITGRLIWNNNFSATPPYGSDVNPVWANGKLYTVMPDAVYALNSANGAVIWSYPTVGTFDANPVMAGNLLITAFIRMQSKIVAINAETGVKAWEYIVNASICKNPVVYNDLVIFGGSDGVIYALDHLTGTLVWSRDFSVGYNNLGAHLISPVIYQNLVIVHDGNSGFYGLNAANGSTVWNAGPMGTPNISSPAIGNDMLYFTGDGEAFALKAATGNLVWDRKYSQLSGWPVPICVHDRLYFGNRVTIGYGIWVLDAFTGDLLPNLAAKEYQWGNETIVNNDTTYYFSPSGMVQ